MRTLLIGLSCILLSCAHKQVLPTDDFCAVAQMLFEQKLIGTKDYMMKHAERVIDIDFTNQRIKCQNGVAYAGFTMVLTLKDGYCGLINTIISFTDTPDEVIYKLEDIGDEELVPCSDPAPTGT